jgi:hypothetical protein
MKMSGGGMRQTLEQMIERDDPSLDTVLNDSELLTECKWGNQKVVKLLEIFK